MAKPGTQQTAPKHSADSSDIVDYGDKIPLIPGASGGINASTILEVQRFSYVQSKKDFAKSYYAMVGEVLHSTQEGVSPGEQRRRMFTCPTNAKNQNPRMREIRNVVCGMYGEDSNNSAFKVDPKIEELVGQSESDAGLDPGRYLKVKYIGSNYLENDDGSRKLGDDGKEIEFPRYTYSQPTDEELDEILGE